MMATLLRLRITMGTAPGMSRRDYLDQARLTLNVGGTTP